MSRLHDDAIIIDIASPTNISTGKHGIKSKMGHLFSTVAWESPAGGKFRIFSRFYDVFGLEDWKPVEVQERVIGNPYFAKVGECLVIVELKPNGRHEIEFRKEKQWSAKQVRALDRALDGLNTPYHWWGLVVIRPHIRLSKEAAQKAAAEKAKALDQVEPETHKKDLDKGKGKEQRIVTEEKVTVVDLKETVEGG